jgi:hypothetical protein
VEADALLDRPLGLRNDLGLLSEEYDIKTGRQVRNFPRAFCISRWYGQLSACITKNRYEITWKAMVIVDKPASQ